MNSIETFFKLLHAFCNISYAPPYIINSNIVWTQILGRNTYFFSLIYSKLCFKDLVILQLPQYLYLQMTSNKLILETVSP